MNTRKWNLRQHHTKSKWVVDPPGWDITNRGQTQDGTTWTEAGGRTFKYGHNRTKHGAWLAARDYIDTMLHRVTIDLPRVEGDAELPEIAPYILVDSNRERHDFHLTDKKAESVALRLLAYVYQRQHRLEKIRYRWMA